MSESTTTAADRPLPTAALFGTGVFLLTVGLPMLAVAWYQSLRYDSLNWAYPEPTNVGTILFVISSIVLLVGAAVLAIAVYRLVHRADRAAGVVARQLAGVVDTKQPTGAVDTKQPTGAVDTKQPTGAVDTRPLIPE